MKTLKTILILSLALLLLAGCAAAPAETTAPAQTTAATTAPAETTAETQSPVADSSDMAPVEDVVTADMTPVSGDALVDGTYAVTVDSSSSMFNIVGCELTVAGGEMTAVMHMGGTGYLYIYPGTGEEAAAAESADYIPFTEEADGAHSFTMPVEALDQGIPCAAFSKNKEKWYDRTLVFRADSLPLEAFRADTVTTVQSLGLADGSYYVEATLSGGSGKAYVQSPALLEVEDGEAWVTLVWSSSNYDYMKLDEEVYEPLTIEGGSTFRIPVTAFDRNVPVLANTTAMSTPHEIEYTLFFDSSTITAQ